MEKEKRRGGRRGKKSNRIAPLEKEQIPRRREGEGRGGKGAWPPAAAAAAAFPYPGLWKTKFPRARVWLISHLRQSGFPWEFGRPSTGRGPYGREKGEKEKLFLFLLSTDRKGLFAFGDVALARSAYRARFRGWLRPSSLTEPRRPSRHKSRGAGPRGSPAGTAAQKKKGDNPSTFTRQPAARILRRRGNPPLRGLLPEVWRRLLQRGGTPARRTTRPARVLA
jgi:hypothetical protein